jgi:hypothetical protein
MQDLVHGSISQIFLIYKKVLVLLNSNMEVLFYKQVRTEGDHEWELYYTIEDGGYIQFVEGNT